MFVLLVYDVGVQRVNRALKTARRYLTWVQNSVFEGEMTPGDLKALKQDLAEVIDPEHDSVLFYVWRVGRYASREIMGVERGARSNFV